MADGLFVFEPLAVVVFGEIKAHERFNCRDNDDQL